MFNQIKDLFLPVAIITVVVIVGLKILVPLLPLPASLKAYLTV